MFAVLNGGIGVVAVSTKVTRVKNAALEAAKMESEQILLILGEGA